MENTNQTAKEMREELVKQFNLLREVSNGAKPEYLESLTNSMLEIYSVLSPSDYFSFEDELEKVRQTSLTAYEKPAVVCVELNGESVARAIEEVHEEFKKEWTNCEIGGLEEKQCPVCTSGFKLEGKETNENYSFENGMKELTKKKMELMNLISRFAIDNEMSFEQIEECVEKIKELYLKDGLIRK